MFCVHFIRELLKFVTVILIKRKIMALNDGNSVFWIAQAHEAEVKFAKVTAELQVATARLEQLEFERAKLREKKEYGSTGEPLQLFSFTRKIAVV